MTGSRVAGNFGRVPVEATVLERNQFWQDHGFSIDGCTLPVCTYVDNTYSAGAILDPPLTFVGANTIIGHDAALFSHAIEGSHFSLNAIRIGDNVTIGATAVIMSDVIIGDGAIVSAGAVVSKGTRIAAGEVWGGMPARLLKAAP